MVTKTKEILSHMPYGKNFLFVDDIQSIDKEAIRGSYHFKSTEAFYADHFESEAITPGVILLECMGQIGCVAHGIYLLDLEISKYTPVFSHAEVEFFQSVYPDTVVEVQATKKYLRKNHLRSDIIMTNKETGETIARANAMCTFIEK